MLRTNYRSNKSIVDFANHSISFNNMKVDKIMLSNNTKIRKPKLIINNYEHQSNKFIIETINELLIAGVNYDDIAILSRNSIKLRIIETELTKNKIPHIALITDKNSDENKKIIEKDKVVITTIHKSKGLEWKYVFIIGLANEHFPSHMNNNIKNIEEERRLFYVAITRCKNELFFITETKEFPLSVFLYESIELIDVENKTKKDDIFNNKIKSNIKTNYAVMDIVNLLNQNDFEQMRLNELLPTINPNIVKRYDNKLNFSKNIKSGAYEGDLGEFVDRYITRGVMKEFRDYDTEFIINDSLENTFIDENNNVLTTEFKYPEIIINKIKKAYDNIKIEKSNNINDIYWISLCRNFKYDRKRLIYRDIFNIIEENIKIGTEEDINDTIKNRMDDYIENYKIKEDINCKVMLQEKFKNNLKIECVISGEIDMIDDDTIIDFKCSESDFKLEWLIQLLIYYSLYNNEKIKKLMIINIMDGMQYTFILPEIYKNIELIDFIKNKIIQDQKSIRNFPSINYETLTNDYQQIDEKIKIQKIKYENISKDNIIILDTETSGLGGECDIIQLAYIIVDKQYNLIKKRDYYVKNRLTTIEAEQIHRITNEKLKTKGKEFLYIIKKLMKDLRDVDIIVGHNVAFDLNKILCNLKKYEIMIISKENEEIQNIFTKFIIEDTYKLGKKKLTELYKDLFNKEMKNAHNALTDVLMTFECYKKLK
jgi:DNA polymerase III epsilon subunit-like protein